MRLTYICQLKSKKAAGLVDRNGQHVTLLSLARGGAIHRSELKIAKSPVWDFLSGNV